MQRVLFLTELFSNRENGINETAEKPPTLIDGKLNEIPNTSTFFASVSNKSYKRNTNYSHSTLLRRSCLRCMTLWDSPVADSFQWPLRNGPRPSRIQWEPEVKKSF